MTAKGLGYPAEAVLAETRITHLLMVEYLASVIERPEPESFPSARRWSTI